MQNQQADLNPLPGELTDDDIQYSREFLSKLSLFEVMEWAKNKTEVYYCGERSFQMVVDQNPELKGSKDDEVIVFLTEFGTNILPRAVVKALLLRDMLNPNATLAMLPSSVFGESNMHYDGNERRSIYDGKMQPLIARMAIMMDSIGNPQTRTFVGSSEGAMSAHILGANEPESVKANIVALETPTVVSRTIGQLANDFKTSSPDLADVVAGNFSDHTNDFAVLAEKDASSPLRQAAWFGRALHPDNIATAGAMRFDSAEDDFRTILKNNGNLVHAWAGSSVSPAWANEAIAKRLIEEYGPDKYKPRVITGLSHAAGDFDVLLVALARLARDDKK